MFIINLQLKFKLFNTKNNKNNHFKYNKLYLMLINLKCLK